MAPLPTHAPYTPNPIISAHAPARSLVELRGRDLLTLTQLTKPCVLELFALAQKLKHDRDHRGTFARTLLDNRTLILIFEKASLRTRITFETGAGLLGARAIYMDHSQQRLGVRESIKDYGKNLERWLDAIVARVYSQAAIEELAEHAEIPVINALSDRYHPCQALADLLTIYQLSDQAPASSHSVTPSLRHSVTISTTQPRIAYVGDGNNVCHSLMHAATMLGCHITVITPKGYAPDQGVIAECEQLAKANQGSLEVTTKLNAVERHHAVYTDVWVSMGQADEEGKRLKVFADYQIDSDLMAKATTGLASTWGPSKFMHCLPARRGVEVTDDVIDAPSSVVYDQAENRMHAQNALMAAVLGG
jgi:ornithine carbamoyltransferase